MLTEEDIIPLLLLESMLQSVSLPLPDIPHHINEDFSQVGRRHSWDGVFPMSFTYQVTCEYREKVCVTKFSAFCIEALHKIQIEKCTIYCERAFSMIRMEDHATLQHNLCSAFQECDTLPPNLERHRHKTDIDTRQTSHHQNRCVPFFTSSIQSHKTQDLLSTYQITHLMQLHTSFLRCKTFPFISAMLLLKVNTINSAVIMLSYRWSLQNFYCIYVLCFIMLFYLLF